MAKINERFILILKTFFSKNVSEMARKTGIPQPTLNNIVANRLNSPSAENIERLLNSMENISAEWLLTGKGEMLKNNQTNENINGNTGIVGNNVNGGGINDTAVMNEIVKMLNKKDEQIDRLLSLLEERKTNAK